MESLSNDDGDGKENAHLAFFVHFFAVRHCTTTT